MKDAAPQPVRLADYTPPAYLIDTVHLTFKLDPNATRVTSKIAFRPNPDAEDRTFRLDGEKLQLIRAMVDGVPVDPRVDAQGLVAEVPNAPFVWECEVEIDPAANTELEGLYTSNGLYCTQCEAEGFRKITYYPDRPDVMGVFTVRIEGDAPVCMSNGNPVASGDGWAEWHDRWPKPAYLFALVAGDLVAHSGTFQTMEGRDVALNIWVRPGDEDRCAYALDSLVRSMKWDEEVYGRAYDLDVFNLVAVDDFNAGAMENKGLNIFNSKYVLASPETATDRDYEFIEGIVAHEYFHNWTGNRITCRDWFQLCLKEGLTVFRDQQFSGDMRGHAVKRIDDALMLRARQFREDAGPLAHPVRPEEYIEINNFYTATVYEKGAEVIGVLKTLVGDAAFYEGCQRYFERHDGQACTVEDWLACFADDIDEQFKLWYTQAGTPILHVSEEWDEDRGIYYLTVRQETKPTPGQDEKKPLRMDVRFTLLDNEGRVIPYVGERKLFIWKEEHRIPVHNLKDETRSKPVLSFNRGFSVPAIVEFKQSPEERITLLGHDTDPFNRWEAGRTLAKDTLVRMIVQDEAPEAAYLEAIGRLAADEALDPAFRALALGLPSEDDLAQTLYDNGRTPDPDRIHDCRNALSCAVAKAHTGLFEDLVARFASNAPYSPNAADAGRRALRLKALGYLADAGQVDRAAAVYAGADNMTESIGALSILVRAGQADAELVQFFNLWNNDPNTLDKWFSTMIVHAPPEHAVEVAQKAVEMPEFAWKTPNRFRAVIGGLCGNTAGFHTASGDGYRLVAEWLKKLDPVNPMTAARMATVFETMRRYDGDRQGQMRDALEYLLEGSPSKDMTEIAGRILGR
ncbi:MAG: aminopeptidase N [Paracoccaceae bacterium]|nr:aminopeptidase N [Paracoccaceae bacterium]